MRIPSLLNKIACVRNGKPSSGLNTVNRWGKKEGSILWEIMRSTEAFVFSAAAALLVAAASSAEDIDDAGNSTTSDSSSGNSSDSSGSPPEPHHGLELATFKYYSEGVVLTPISVFGIFGE